MEDNYTNTTLNDDEVPAKCMEKRLLYLENNDNAIIFKF